MSDNHTDHSGHDHEHDHEHDHNEYDTGGITESQPQSGLSARDWQIVSIVTIPIIAAVGLICSAYLSRYKDSLLLVCATIFSGGIVLAVGISHMLPEAQEVLEGSFDGFPMSYTLFGACYIFLLFVDAGADRWSETLVHKGDIKAPQNKEKDIVCAEDGINDEADVDKGDTKAPQNHEHGIVCAEYVSNDKADVDDLGNHDGHTHGLVHSGHNITNPWAGLLLAIKVSVHSILEYIVLGSSVSKGGIKAPQDQEKDIVCLEAGSNDKEDVKEVHDHGNHDGPHDHVHSGHDIANPWAGLLLTIVLSIHAILECLVLGSSTDVESTIQMYISIATHKFFASFALGCSLVESGYWIEGNRGRFYSCALTFVLLNLVSIGIGMGLSQTFSENSNSVGILNALVAGSFFYVGAAEFVPVQMGKMRALRLPVIPVMLSLIAGYLLMVLLTAYTHPEHDHDHGDHEGHDHF